jgi:hypothetical protein
MKHLFPETASPSRRLALAQIQGRETVKPFDTLGVPLYDPKILI